MPLSAFADAQDIWSLPEFTERRLTDAELEKLNRGSARTMRKEISTIADAKALLNLRYPQLWMDYCTMFYPDDPAKYYRDAVYFLDPGNDSNAGRSGEPMLPASGGRNFLGIGIPCAAAG